MKPKKSAFINKYYDLKKLLKTFNKHHGQKMINIEKENVLNDILIKINHISSTS